MRLPKCNCDCVIGGKEKEDEEECKVLVGLKFLQEQFLII